MSIKISLLTLMCILFFNVCFTQYTSHKCPLGQRYLSGLVSSGMRVENGCYESKVADTLERDFWKELCEGESSSMIASSKNLVQDRQGYWINDKVGCVTKEIFKKGEWISKNGKVEWTYTEIPEQEYHLLEKTRSKGHWVSRGWLE